MARTSRRPSPPVHSTASSRQVQPQGAELAEATLTHSCGSALTVVGRWRTIRTRSGALTTVLTTTSASGPSQRQSMTATREFQADAGERRRYPRAHLGNPGSAVQSRPCPPGSYLTECPKMSAKMSTAPSIGGVTLLPRSSGLGRKDSNLRMGDPKSPALPLGDAPPSRIRLEELDRPRRPEPAETPVHGTCLWRPGTRPGASKAADRPRTVIG